MDKTISRNFFNERAEHWDDTVRNNDPVKLQRMAERLHISQDDWILDVGTGTGVFIPYLAKKINGNGRILSLDYAINMLIQAIRKQPPNGRLDYVCAEIETLRLTGQTFDVVNCYSTFPHFHDKPAALGNLHHLLRLGGRLYICHTASKETINNIHSGIPDFQDHLIPPNEEMRTLLSQTGFGEIEIENRAESYLVKAKKIQP